MIIVYKWIIKFICLSIILTGTLFANPPSDHSSDHSEVKEVNSAVSQAKKLHCSYQKGNRELNRITDSKNMISDLSVESLSDHALFVLSLSKGIAPHQKLSSENFVEIKDKLIAQLDNLHVKSQVNVCVKQKVFLKDAFLKVSKMVKDYMHFQNSIPNGIDTVMLTVQLRNSLNLLKMAIFDKGFFQYSWSKTDEDYMSCIDHSYSSTGEEMSSSQEDSLKNIKDLVLEFDHLTQKLLGVNSLAQTFKYSHVVAKNARIQLNNLAMYYVYSGLDSLISLPFSLIKNVPRVFSYFLHSPDYMNFFSFLFKIKLSDVLSALENSDNIELHSNAYTILKNLNVYFSIGRHDYENQLPMITDLESKSCIEKSILLENIFIEECKNIKKFMHNNEDYWPRECHYQKALHSLNYKNYPELKDHPKFKDNEILTNAKRMINRSHCIVGVRSKDDRYVEFSMATESLKKLISEKIQNVKSLPINLEEFALYQENECRQLGI